MNNRRVKRLILFSRLLDRMEEVPGDIVECGVADGKGLVMLALAIENTSQQRTIVGFDSFSGLPPPTREDLDAPEPRAKEGRFAASTETCLRRLRNAGCSAEVQLVEGWFKDTLPKYNGQIALLSLDADLYESTRLALEHLWPRVSVGGFLVLDEYNTPATWPGERKAVDEYFALKQDSIRMYQCPYSERAYVQKCGL